MNNSLQYRRTDKAIVNAFCSLCLSESFESITVKKILDEALVSRNTFYAHYKDKYEIVEKLFNQFVTALQELIQDVYKSGPDSMYALSQAQRDQVMNRIHKQFFQENQVLISVLFRIQTKEFNIQETLKHYFAQRYFNDPDVRTQGEQRRTEANVYASIQSPFISAGISNSSTPIISSDEEIASAVVNAALYSIGVRDPEAVNELYTAIMDKRKAACNVEVL